MVGTTQMPFFILAKMRNFVFSKLMQITAKITQFRENDKIFHSSHASFSIFLHKFSRKQLFPFFKNPKELSTYAYFLDIFCHIRMYTILDQFPRRKREQWTFRTDVFAKIENAKRLISTQGTPGLS
jgi:hypothetical protein